MTRKKYDKDTTQEEIDRWAAAQYETSSGSDDEEYIPDPDEVWEDIEWYLSDQLQHGNHDWVYKWISPDFFIREEIPNFIRPDFYTIVRHYLMPYENREGFAELYSHVYNILHICNGLREKPEYGQVDSMVIYLLQERTKYYFIGNHVKHQTIINNKFFKQLQRV